MPSRIEIAQNLENKYLKSARKANNAPRANREKIRNVIQIFRDNNNVTRNTAERVVTALYLPSAFGHVGRKGKTGKADEICEDFLSRDKDANIEGPNKQRPGIKRNYELRVVLFTQARKQDPNKEPFQQDEEAEQIIQKEIAQVRPSQAQGSAAVLDGKPGGQNTQRQSRQPAEGQADDKRHQRVQTAVSHLHDR